MVSGDPGSMYAAGPVVILLNALSVLIQALEAKLDHDAHGLGRGWWVWVDPSSSEVI